MLLPGLGMDEALQLIERLRRAVEAPGDETPAVTASFGVVETSGLGSTRELLMHVDRALYRAKRAGKSRVAAARNRAAVSWGMDPGDLLHEPPLTPFGEVVPPVFQNSLFAFATTADFEAAMQSGEE